MFKGLIRITADHRLIALILFVKWLISFRLVTGLSGLPPAPGKECSRKQRGEHEDGDRPFEGAPAHLGADRTSGHDSAAAAYLGHVFDALLCSRCRSRRHLQRRCPHIRHPATPALAVAGPCVQPLQERQPRIAVAVDPVSRGAAGCVDLPQEGASSARPGVDRVVENAQVEARGQAVAVDHIPVALAIDGLH